MSPCTHYLFTEAFGVGPKSGDDLKHPLEITFSLSERRSRVWVSQEGSCRATDSPAGRHFDPSSIPCPESHPLTPGTNQIDSVAYPYRGFLPLPRGPHVRRGRSGGPGCGRRCTLGPRPASGQFPGGGERFETTRRATGVSRGLLFQNWQTTDGVVIRSNDIACFVCVRVAGRWRWPERRRCVEVREPTCQIHGIHFVQLQKVDQPVIQPWKEKNAGRQSAGDRWSNCFENPFGQNPWPRAG